MAFREGIYFMWMSFKINSNKKKTEKPQKNVLYSGAFLV